MKEDRVNSWLGSPRSAAPGSTLTILAYGWRACSCAPAPAPRRTCGLPLMQNKTLLVRKVLNRVVKMKKRCEILLQPTAPVQSAASSPESSALTSSCCIAANMHKLHAHWEKDIILFECALLSLTCAHAFISSTVLCRCVRKRQICLFPVFDVFAFKCTVVWALSSPQLECDPLGGRILLSREAWMRHIR